MCRCPFRHPHAKDVSPSLSTDSTDAPENEKEKNQYKIKKHPEIPKCFFCHIFLDTDETYSP